jgi:hypothetical protein
LREQLLDRLRQQVRGRVANDFQALGIALGDELELAILRNARARPAPMLAATSATVTG